MNFSHTFYIPPPYSFVPLGDMELELEGCIRTLLVIERGSFPDEGCLGCENLKKCLKLEPGVRRGLAAEKTEAV